MGDINFLVNNAGAIPQGTVVSFDEKAWRKAWHLKVWGFINLSRGYYARMAKKKSGVIVTVIGAAGYTTRCVITIGWCATGKIFVLKQIVTIPLIVKAQRNAAKKLHQDFDFLCVSFAPLR